MMLKYYMMVPRFTDVQQKSQKLCLLIQDSVEKSDNFRTAPGTDDDVATTTCILGFPVHLSFIFLNVFKNKWKLMHTKFLVHWVKIMRGITQLHELSEQPTYLFGLLVLWFNNPLNNQLVRLRWSLYFFGMNQYCYNQHHGKVNMACTTLWWRAQTPTSLFRVWATVVVLQTFVILA